MKLKAIAMVAAMSVLAACAKDTRVLGESLDSGLGELSADYTGWEFMPAGRVRGESLDSGLGELGPDYTAAEFVPSNVPADSSERYLATDPKLWVMPL
jgi:hypothetical protein